ncbi:hypothetical protein C8J56DRAFT_1057753 [Mycena floridula]|nr:hypothetical protein C8J56DRAFT_1057753 [Mycena floridula]
MILEQWEFKVLEFNTYEFMLARNNGPERLAQFLRNSYFHWTLEHPKSDLLPEEYLELLELRAQDREDRYGPFLLKERPELGYTRQPQAVRRASVATFSSRTANVTASVSPRPVSRSQSPLPSSSPPSSPGPGDWSRSSSPMPLSSPPTSPFTSPKKAPDDQDVEMASFITNRRADLLGKKRQASPEPEGPSATSWEVKRRRTQGNA